MNFYTLHFLGKRAALIKKGRHTNVKRVNVSCHQKRVKRTEQEL